MTCQSLSPLIESLNVEVMEFCRQECLDRVGPLFFLDLREKIGEGADENHVPIITSLVTHPPTFALQSCEYIIVARIIWATTR
jgi:hypothetical protein